MELFSHRKDRGSTMIQKGILKQFSGSFGSGLGQLSIKVDGTIKQFHCDNGTTARSLESAFGNVITEGHTANGAGYKNQEVYFSIDEFGVLEGFTPVEEAGIELVEQFEKEGAD